jgi:hypothetical protein
MKTNGITIFITITFLISSCTPLSSISLTPAMEEMEVLNTPTTTDTQARFFIVVSDVYTETFEPVTPLPQNESRFPASLDEAETLAGFKILEPTFLPDGYVLIAIDYSAGDQHVGLLYHKDSQSHQLYFLQQRTAFSKHQSLIGASALIQKLQVNDASAEYVQGGFDNVGGSTSTVNSLRWNPLADKGSFRWQKDNYYFQISTGRDIDSAILRHMAESLKQHMVTPNATPLPTLTFEETPLSSISLTPAMEEMEVLDTPTSSANTAYPLLKTSMGDFIVISARLVDEVHGDESPPGEKFLLIGLARPGLEKLVMSEFSFESFQNMISDSPGEIYVLGSDGSQILYRGMGGWLDGENEFADEFVMGFTVPLVETYTLYWNNNPPIRLNIEE